MTQIQLAMFWLICGNNFRLVIKAAIFSVLHKKYQSIYLRLVEKFKEILEIKTFIVSESF